MIGWIAAGAIFTITCFASKTGHQQAPLVGAVTTAAVLWTCKLFKKPSSESGFSGPQLKKLEDEFTHGLNLPIESDNQACALKPESSEVLLVEEKDCALMQLDDSGSQDHSQEKFSENGSELQFVNSSSDLKQVILEDHVEIEETMSTSDRLVENRVSQVDTRDSVLMPSDESGGEDRGQELSEIGIEVQFMNASSNLKRAILEDHGENEETVSNFVKLLENDVSNGSDKKDVARTFYMSQNLHSLSSARYSLKGADEFNSTSSFEHKNGSESDDEINRHISSNQYATSINLSITSNDSHQDEKLDPSSVWKFLITDDAKIDAKKDNSKSVLELSVPSHIEAEDALTLSGATCSSGSLPSPNHVIINPNILEGISLDVQLGPWDEVASAQSLINTNFGGPSSLPLDANAIQITDACFSRTSEKLISTATSLESDDTRTQSPSLTQSLCDPFVEDTLGKYEVSVLSQIPLAIIRDSQEISSSVKKGEVFCDTEASLSSLSKASALTDNNNHTVPIFKEGSINACGRVPDSALSVSSFSDPEEKLVECFLLDPHFDSHDGASEPSEKLPTTSWGSEDTLPGNSLLKEVSFRYGANGDSDIFDILNSPTSSATEKNLLLDALDGETINPWTNNFQNKRAASTSSVKSMHQESFLYAHAEPNSDLYGQMATPTSSFVSGDGAGDTTSFRTAQSNLDSPKSLLSVRNSIQAEKGELKRLASFISDDGELLDHIRPKQLPTVSTIVNNFAEELTPIDIPRDVDLADNAQSTGAADAINTAQRSYPTRAIAYDQYLSDPKLSPQMRWQVLRAKATLKRYYEVEKAAAVPSSVELGKS